MKTGKTVYTLSAQYKDNDPEIIGAYETPRAMILGLATAVGAYHHEERPLAIAKAVAHAVFDMMTKAGGFASERDECRDGDTVYGYEAHDLFSDDDE